MKNLFLIFTILAVFSCTNQSSNDSSSEETESMESSEPEQINKTTCTICNREFEGNGYEEVSDDVWKELEYPYSGTICSQACGRKSVQQLNDVVKKYGVNLNENSSEDYQMGGDGRVYETNACSLCKGTGIEENRSSFSDEVGRVCPMCDGAGVRSY
jgi:hypothetical protein